MTDAELSRISYIVEREIAVSHMKLVKFIIGVVVGWAVVVLQLVWQASGWYSNVESRLESIDQHVVKLEQRIDKMGVQPK